MSDETHWTPHVPAPVRKPILTIRLWTLAKDNHERACELRTHGPNGEWGTEAQLLDNGELLIGQLFAVPDLAMHWATQERTAHEREGWTAPKK